ncbi:hypothetical protein LB169_002308 [Acinetobacter baumannii]|nr:hypothetical protein [Acinetobacter baumannii]EKX9959434.1 hypothetical protein [Acinetobacter baumannii]EKY0928451.1 hypothetical protein [Acinetobacter baumannii]EKY1173496.1 hypothetical protein [Acinetobacter baumannii]HCW3947874.1 hypothetical protein [Acinetobacter baumannii]
MAKYTFLMTYSVSPFRSNYEQTADVIRSRIARLDGSHGWTKLEEVETTFKGTLTLFDPTQEGKRNEAEKEIKEILSSVFDSEYPSHRVWVHVALLVNGLTEIQEFRL